MFDSLQPHGLQHPRPPCLSPTPRVYSNSCPLSWWCHPAISSSVIPFSSPPSVFPSIRVFLNESALPIRWPSIRVSALALVLPMNIQDWFPLGWTGGISLQSKGLSRVFSNSTVSKASILRCSVFFIVQLSLPYITTGKNIALNRWTFVGKVISLLINMLSRLVITFLPRSKCFLISWLHHHLQWLEPKKIKSDTVSPSISHEVMGPDAMIFVFWMLSFKPTLLFHFHQEAF